jgi:cytochrome c oxidase subunit 3
MAVAAHGEQAHGHHMSPARRLAINQLGLWLFFFSESWLFAALAAGRFYNAGTGLPEHLNQQLGLVITSILLLSSVTAYMAENAIARGRRTSFMWFLLATIGLGTIFVGGVALEWSEAEFSVHEPYGTAFFSMTGLHAMHVVSGIAMLLGIFWLGARGRFSPRSYWGVEGVVKYWHFVDVVWVFFYPILYLIDW